MESFTLSAVYATFVEMVREADVAVAALNKDCNDVVVYNKLMKLSGQMEAAIWFAKQAGDDGVTVDHMQSECKRICTSIVLY